MTFISKYYLHFISIKYLTICFLDIPFIIKLSNLLDIYNLPKIKKYEKITCIILLALLWALIINDARLKYRRSCLPTVIASFYGFIPSLIADFEAYIKSDIKPTEPEENLKKCIFKDNHINVGQFDKIFIIQLESIGSNIIDFRALNKEIVPFLNAFKNQCIYIPNMISHHIYGSMDSEFGVLNGKKSSNQGSIFYSSTYDYHQCLRNIFQNYQFSFYHGNNGGFFNRNIAYNHMKFHHFYDSKQLWQFSKEAQYKRTINDFIPDHLFLEIVKTIIQSNNNTLSFHYIETITSHTPFKLYPKNLNNIEKFEGIQEELIKDMFISFNYLDQNLKLFIEWIITSQKDYILILFGDHVPVLAENEIYKPCKLNNIEYVPCFIYFKNVTPIIIHNSEYSHINLYYSLLNIMKKDNYVKTNY